MCSEELKAYIGNIQHFNVHDGNGFRTTVFFQGCGMHCKWCQNPELQSISPIEVEDENAKSYSPSSKLMSVNEVYEECLKEAFFFKFHGGGVTLSGGEPLLNREFSRVLLKKLKVNNINTSVETAGYVPFENINDAYKYVDTFLYDVKLLSKEKREKWLGVSSNLDITNLKLLSELHKQIVIRIPLIKDVNDTEEEFCKILDFIKAVRGIKYVHILPFHQLGSCKYKRIGREYEMEDTELNDRKRILWCKEKLELQGYKVNIGGTGFTYL